ncbi:MAG: hypothetical protein ACFCVC_03525 [Acidimicrobiia bacterium]
MSPRTESAGFTSSAMRRAAAGISWGAANASSEVAANCSDTVNNSVR